MGMFDFLKKKSEHPQYELVEHPIDDKEYRQGVRLLDSVYNGIVVTFSPSIKLQPENDCLRVIFDYTVESNPNHIEFVAKDLHQYLGGIVLDIIIKDNS